MVNNLSSHVLFDLGATQSFMSLALNKKFRDALGTLDSLIEVEIADDRTMNALRVFHGCVLNMFSERFPIDLVSIPLMRIEGYHWDGLFGPQ